MASNHLYRALGLLSAAALGLAGCATPIAGPSGNYASAIGTAPVTANPTPYSGALVCMAGYARNARLVAPRIAVGRIADYTGKSESDGSGRKITQGASLMAMSAFAKAGMPLVERFDTSVSELELKYANNKLISDAPNPAPDQAAEYRRILAGQVPGSDFYVAGGLTELNFNIRSSGADLTGGSPDAKELKGSFRARMFVMNIGLDMRLINTRTLEVVDVISYQKQVVGREVGIGLFDFLGGNVFDVSAGAGALEPMQLAVRALVERAVV
ncbi:MAG: holdfast anchoring protein HfaB, partial [Phenylobacterium sp.]|nr:holdfast anchoring protein HfaB [Phenylobacterium sp.]